MNRFLRAINVGDGVRAAFRALGMQTVPTCSESTSRLALGVAEGQGKVVHRFVVHWGGHKGDITARYSLNKNRLPGDLIEEMREAFRRCEPILTGDAPSEGDVRREVSRTLLGALGYSDKELEAVDLANLAQVRELTLKRVSPPAKKQALVTVEELPGYLDAGWTFVGNVGQDRVLLSPPAGAGGPSESAFAARTAIGRRSGSPSMSTRTGSVSGRPRATFFRGRISTNAWDGSSGEPHASPTGTAGSWSGLGVLSAAPVPCSSAGE